MVHISAKDYFRHTPWWLMLFILTLITAIIAVSIMLIFIFTKGDNVSYCHRYVSVLEKHRHKTGSYPENLDVLYSEFKFEDEEKSRCNYLKTFSGYTLSTDVGFGSAYYISEIKKWGYD